MADVKAALPKPYQEVVLDALTEAPEGFVALGKADVWAVAASNPEADGFYYVLRLNDHADLLVCDDRKAFRYRQKCRHVEKIAENA